MLNHWDLCSGIGGFAFAFETIGLSRPTLFCDIEPWCREVLRKHWPDVPICNDIKEIANDPDRFISGRVDILTSGFPCQPWSVSGKSKNLQQAKEDPRHIWPWIVDIIAQKRPKYLIFENVPNLAGLGGLDEVLVDLANQDYAASTFSISAYAAAGAPHKRERLWIYATNVADTDNEGSQGRLSGGQSKEWQSELGYSGRSSSAHRQPEKDYGSTRSEFCSMADGIPSGMGRFGEHEGWEKEPEGMTRVAVGVPDRVSKLKGLGNAILPQIAQKIGETILKLESLNEKKNKD